MIGRMLTKGAVLVAGVIVSQAVIERLEKAELNRKNKSKNKDSEKKVDEKTDEERFGEILKEHGFVEMEVVN